MHLSGIAAYAVRAISETAPSKNDRRVMSLTSGKSLSPDNERYLPGSDQADTQARGFFGGFFSCQMYKQ